MQATGPHSSVVRKLALATAIAVWALCGAARAQSPAAAPPPQATAPLANPLVIEDPFEKLNRRFYAIHRVLDRVLFKTLALGYEHKTPRPVQAVLHNFVVEVGEPVVFGNDLAQLRIKRAATTLARFVVNATAGIAGLFDPATKIGLPHHDNGFGVTLGRYGIAPGPYIFLPLIGPSTLRDMIGTAVDFYSDPISRVRYPKRGYVEAGIWIISGLDQRARAEGDLEMIDEMGTDSYATLRSLYLQNRESQIHGDLGVSIESLPSFDEEPASPPAAASPPATAAPAAPAQAAPAAPPADKPPAASDPGVSSPSVAKVPAALSYSGPDAAYFLTPPAPPPSATPTSGPPLSL